MGHKVDVSEVVEFSDDLKSASEDIKTSLEKVEENIDQINAMSSFSGKAAKEAKSYFNDLHKTILESFNGLFTDLDDNLKKHLDTFESNVDSNKSAIIQSDYLNDTEGDISDYYEDLKEKYESVKETINSVADISTATAPTFYSVNKSKNEANKVVTDLDDELASFTSEGNVSQAKDLLHQIEVTMNRAKTNDGEARFSDYTGSSKNSGLVALKGYNEGKRKEVEKRIENLDSESQEVLEQARWGHENGDLNKSALEAITTGLITGGTGFLENLMKNKQADELSSEDAKKVAEWGEDNRALFLDPKTMLKEQEELGFEGEKGGYETEELWSINLQINQQKHAQLSAQSEGNNKAEQEAKDKEKQLREKYADLSAHLIKEDEPPHDLPNEQLKLENGEKFNYRVDSEGHLHYKAEPGYEYYEEAHKQSAGQRVQGVLAKTAFTSLVGWGTGSLAANASLKTEAGMSIVGGITGAGSELLGPHKYNVLYVPSTDEVKTMIYRTNKNGETENLVIDSQGKEILKNSGWNDY